MILSKPKPEKRVKTRRSKFVSERKSLVKKLDDIVREIVSFRDSFCVIPGQSHTGVLQCGHLVTRARLSTRWDLYNCQRQCSSCNLKHEFYPEIYTQKFITQFGLIAYRQLVNHSCVISKYTIEELETLLFELTEIRKRQEDNPNFKPYFTQQSILSGTWKESQ